jgi:hypothetical protein
VSRLFEPRYIGDDFFLGLNLVSFNRTLVVPYEISKVNFHAEFFILVSMSRSCRGVLNTTLCDKMYQWLATGRWFSLGTLVSSTNKTDCHDLAEILLKVSLTIITLRVKEMLYYFLLRPIFQWILFKILYKHQVNIIDYSSLPVRLLI